jgi:hypothetical protein
MPGKLSCVEKPPKYARTGHAPFSFPVAERGGFLGGLSWFRGF